MTKCICLQLIQDVEDRYESLERQAAVLREENAGYKADTNQLINIISQARTRGRWEVSGVGMVSGVITVIGRI